VKFASNQKEKPMFRKAILAVSALTIIGAAALAPTTASAGGGKGGHHGHHHGGHWGGKSFYYGGPAYVGYSGYGYGCWVKKWIDTPFGPRLKRVYVCY
jgi:hypothetical protein